MGLYEIVVKSSPDSANSSTRTGPRSVVYTSDHGAMQRPPDLIVPAEASAPRMNDTGPDAVLFVPESVS